MEGLANQSKNMSHKIITWLASKDGYVGSAMIGRKVRIRLGHKPFDSKRCQIDMIAVDMSLPRSSPVVLSNVFYRFCLVFFI